jgi:hypothetical protein
VLNLSIPAVRVDGLCTVVPVGIVTDAVPGNTGLELRLIVATPLVMVTIT